MKTVLKNISFLATVFLLAGAVVSCSGVKSERTTVDSVQSPDEVRRQATGKLFGDDALTFGGPERPSELDAGGGIGVNSFLWRASLDTVTFMPVNSADPFGGVIITDWHTPKEAPVDERFKLNIYILGRALRADGVRVAVFRQVKDGPSWRDAPVTEGVGIKIEDAILMKARQLRYDSAER
jgi:uncharacterized protein DUF3576